MALRSRTTLRSWGTRIGTPPPTEMRRGIAPTPPKRGVARGRNMTPGTPRGRVIKRGTGGGTRPGVISTRPGTGMRSPGGFNRGTGRMWH